MKVWVPLKPKDRKNQCIHNNCPVETASKRTFNFFFLADKTKKPYLELSNYGNIRCTNCGRNLFIDEWKLDDHHKHVNEKGRIPDDDVGIKNAVDDLDLT